MVWVGNTKHFDFLVNLSHVATFIYSLPSDTLKKYDSNRPYFCFLVINIPVKRLRGHVRGRAYIIFKGRCSIALN